MTHCFSLLFPRSLHVQYLLCCSLWSGVPMRLAAVLVWTCCKKKKSRPQFFCIYRRGLPWLYNEPGGYVAEMRSAPVTSYMMQWWRWEGVNREEQLYSAVISPNRLSSISKKVCRAGFPTAIMVEMSSSTTTKKKHRISRVNTPDTEIGFEKSTRLISLR